MCHEICCNERLKSIQRRTRLTAVVGLVLAAILMFAPSLVPDQPERVVMLDRVHAEDAQDHDWRVSEASWYGPNFFGRRTACGQILQRDSQWVAHKSLPCGTLVRFEWHGRELVLPVLDRGPYTSGREWDLTQGACEYLGRCWTGDIAWTR